MPEDERRQIEALRAEIMADLRALPVASHERVFSELADAAATTMATDDPQPFRVFLQRLHASAAIRETPYFSKHLREARETEPQRGRMSAKELAQALHG